MIEIHLGNIGSGKTASMVREIVQNLDGKHTFSNIVMNDVPNNTAITPEMIVAKTIDEKGKVSYELNVAFWKDVVKKYKSINVVIDEAHTILNARRSMSKQNILMSDFLALLRRVIGSATEKAGKLVLISQLHNRLDLIARDMATRIKWNRCHYEIYCTSCGAVFSESNETPEKITYCLECESKNIKTQNFIIEVFCFKNIGDYLLFEEFGMKKYYSRYVLTDIEDYFGFYDTYQWDNLLSDIA